MNRCPVLVQVEAASTKVECWRNQSRTLALSSGVACHRSLQNAPPAVTSKCTTSDGRFVTGLGGGWQGDCGAERFYFRTKPICFRQRGMKVRPARRRAGQAAVCGIEVGSRKGSAKRRLTGPSRRVSEAVVLCGPGFTRPGGGSGDGGLVRDTGRHGRQAVAATVDGDDLGAMQQTVEDGSSGGNVA